jgi:hypothetical protein
MQDIIVNPSEQRRFATFLREKNKTMRGGITRMGEAVNDARHVWKDEKYNSFTKKLVESLDLLLLMLKTSEKYADFLEKKASLGEKYLRRR